MLGLLVFLAGIAGSSPSAPVSQAPQGHFRLVLERSDSGFTAHCEAGCSWKELTFRCVADCHALIDANGVALNPESRATTSPFAFRLHPTVDGWAAESVAGTAWISLSYGCGTVACRARVTEFGVSGLGTI